MKDIPFRISSDIDAFWQDADASPEERPLRLLVLCPALAEGSEEETLVHNIVKACKIPENQTQILTAENNAFPSWQSLRKTYLPEVVLNMGVLPQHLAIHAVFPVLKPISFGESHWITVGSPAALLQDRDMRQALWTDVLKPHFGG